MTEYKCEVCKDSGWVKPRDDLQWDEPGFGKLEKCECQPKEIKELKKPKDRSGANLDWIHK